MNKDALIDVFETFERDIEIFLAKIGQRRSKRQLKIWIQNFQEEDYIYALELFSKMTYVSEEELYYQCQKYLSQAVLGHPGKVYIHPIERFGKSSTLLSYYLKKTEIFNSLDKQKRILFISAYQDLTKRVFSKHDLIIYLDDFFGTGNSLIKAIEYTRRNGHPSIRKIKNKRALCIYYMDVAKQKLNDFDHTIKILGNLHHKLFDTYLGSFAPSTFAENYRNKARLIVQKRQMLIKGDAEKYYELGYYDSEAFITFPYLTPNNSIPFLWWNRNSWFPLFPREYRSLEKIYLDTKSEVMTLSMENYFRLDLSKSKMFKFQQTTFFMVMILLMIKKGTARVLILQILGIDEMFFNDMLKLLINENLLYDNFKISSVGESRIMKLIKEIKKIKSEKLSQFVTFEEVQYVPKSLN